MQALTWIRRPLTGINDWLFAAVDARTYAAVRVSVGLSALGVWLELFPLRYALFSEEGLLGTSSASRSLTLNVFALGDGTAAVDAVFASALIAITCLCAGVFCRVAAIGVYLWTVSYSAQAPISLQGFDTVLRSVTFALALSPTSSCWSLRPHWFSGGRDPAPRYGLRILQWQLLLIYWCTVWLKAPDSYWRRGEVISYMAMSNFARFPTPLAADLGWVDALLTWGTLLIELLVPILLWKRSTRGLGLFLGLLLHGGIAATSKLALFSLAMLPLYVAFLERQDWEWLSSMAAGVRRRKAE